MKALRERHRRSGVKNMQSTTKEFLSRNDLAAMFGVTVTTIVDWQKRGRLTPMKLANRTVRYRRSEVEAFIAAASAGSTNNAEAQAQ
jgi:predicted DNA-binding transcriptional regulator AlpA